MEAHQQDRQVCVGNLQFNIDNSEKINQVARAVSEVTKSMGRKEAAVLVMSRPDISQPVRLDSLTSEDCRALIEFTSQRSKSTYTPSTTARRTKLNKSSSRSSTLVSFSLLRSLIYPVDDEERFFFRRSQQAGIRHGQLRRRQQDAREFCPPRSEQSFLTIGFLPKANYAPHSHTGPNRCLVQNGAITSGFNDQNLKSVVESFQQFTEGNE